MSETARFIRNPDPLNVRSPIVDSRGRPTPSFIRQWLSQRNFNVEVEGLSEVAIELFNQRAINTTAPLAGGGTLATDLTLSLAASGVTPSTYGDATNIPQITIDATGRITAAANVAASGGGGGSGGGYFSGFPIRGPSITSAASAIKGIRIRPDVDITVTHMIHLIDQAAGGDNYKGIIAELSDDTSLATVSSITGITNLGSTGSTNIRFLRTDFASPVNLTASTVYFIGTAIDTLVGTTAARVAFDDAHILQAPVETLEGRVFYATPSLSVSQTFDTFAASEFVHVGLEGTIT